MCFVSQTTCYKNIRNARCEGNRFALSSELPLWNFSCAKPWNNAELTCFLLTHMNAIQYVSIKLHFMLYNKLDNHGNSDRENTPWGNRVWHEYLEILPMQKLLILFWFMKLLHHRMLLWIWNVHILSVQVTNLQGQQKKKSLTVVTLLMVTVQSVCVL